MNRFLIVIASLVLFLFAATEILVGYPIAWWLYAMVLALFAGGLLRIRPLPQQRRRLLGFAGVCVVVAVLHLVPWSIRKTFLRDLHRVRPGMTVGEVEAIMGGYLHGTGLPPNPFGPPTGPPPNPTIVSARVYRHTETIADWGIVHFRNGRVRDVRFSPD
jgi:hypothetical protein